MGEKVTLEIGTTPMGETGLSFSSQEKRARNKIEYRWDNMQLRELAARIDFGCVGLRDLI